jgi:membrane associated rhomboid family serine protease
MLKDLFVFVQKIRFPILFVLILWLIKSIEYISGSRLYYLGIYPREWSGLPGIFTSPFIHASWGHIASNTLPLLVLMAIVVIFYKKVASQSIITIILGTGFLVWLFARPSYHIGASGVVYGLISFIFWTGVFKKNSKSIVLALIVLTLYAGSVESIFPNVEKNISWESHLFGGIVGIITAFIFKNVIEEDEEKFLDSPWSDNNEARTYFLPRDAFDKTKTERFYESLLNDGNQSDPT